MFWVLCTMMVKLDGNFKTVELEGYVSMTFGSEYIVDFRHDAERKGIKNLSTSEYVNISDCRKI